MIGSKIAISRPRLMTHIMECLMQLICNSTSLARYFRYFWCRPFTNINWHTNVWE